MAREDVFDEEGKGDSDHEFEDPEAADDAGSDDDDDPMQFNPRGKGRNQTKPKTKPKTNLHVRSTFFFGLDHAYNAHNKLDEPSVEYYVCRIRCRVK